MRQGPELSWWDLEGLDAFGCGAADMYVLDVALSSAES